MHKIKEEEIKEFEYPDGICAVRKIATGEHEDIYFEIFQRKEDNSMILEIEDKKYILESRIFISKMVMHHIIKSDVERIGKEVEIEKIRNKKLTQHKNEKL